ILLTPRKIENGRCVRESECRRVRRSVRHGRGPPVRLGIPIARAGVTLPCYAAGPAGLDAKHQDKRAEIAVTSGSGVFMGSRRVARGVQPCPAFISLIS